MMRKTAPKADTQFVKQLNGYSLTTAEIIYHMPDAQSLLQSFIWQDYDLAPKYPKLEKFLAFWERELDGPIHSVRVASERLLRRSTSRRGTRSLFTDAADTAPAPFQAPRAACMKFR